MALAATAAFLARQPLKLLVSDRRHGKRYPRTAMAERGFTVCALVAAAALAGAVALARGPLLVAVGLAAPAAAVVLALDLGRRSREAAAEVTAAATLCSTASAIALAAGAPAPQAIGLWGVLLARAIPAVYFVRARLRLDRGERANRSGPLLAHVAALAVVCGMALRGLAPWTGVVAMGLLLARAALGLSARRPRLTVPQLGTSEILFGLITVILVAWGAASR